MHVPVPPSPSPSVLDICYLSVIYTLCTMRFSFFSLMIPQPYPIPHSALVHLRQDQITRAFYAVIDWYGLFSYVEQSTFFRCLSQVMTGLGWISFDSFFFSLLSFSFYIYFWESKAYRASDGLSSVEIRLGNGVIVSCVVILLTLHASQVIYICWLFFFGCSYTIPNYFC